MEIKVALKERKKKKNISDVTSKAAPIKMPISSTIFWALRVLTYGIPDVRTSKLFVSSNVLIKQVVSWFYRYHCACHGFMKQNHNAASAIPQFFGLINDFAAFAPYKFIYGLKSLLV